MLYLAATEHETDLTLARNVAEALDEHYPGWLWGVNVKSGVVIIKNFYISNKYGMVLHYNKLGDATSAKQKVIRMAGEFLERAGAPRGPRPDSWVMQQLEVA